MTKCDVVGTYSDYIFDGESDFGSRGDLQCLKSHKQVTNVV